MCSTFSPQRSDCHAFETTVSLILQRRHHIGHSMTASRQPWRLVFALVALLVVAALPQAAALIKQAQLGEADWLLQHVGEVQHAQFAPRGPKVFVATGAAAVACLHLRDGEIIWRQVRGLHSGAAS